MLLLGSIISFPLRPNGGPAAIFSAGIRAHYDAAPAMQGLKRFIVGVLRLLPHGESSFFSLVGILFVFGLVASPNSRREGDPFRLSDAAMSWYSF